MSSVGAEKSNSSETLTRIRGLIVFVLVLSALGSLAAFKIPIQFVLLTSAGLALLLMFAKLIKDNRELALQVGMRRLMMAMFIAGILFLFVSFILVPGFWLSWQVSHYSTRGISWLENWSAPNIVTEEILNQIPIVVEERVNRNLPWWYGPLVFVGIMNDYATQLKNEVETVTETISHAVPKPAHVRATAGVLKAALLAINVYSTFWLIVLSIRAYSSLVGRILVASTTPVIFECGKTRISPKIGVANLPCSSEIEIGMKVDVALEDGEEFYVRRNDLPSNSPPDLRPRLKGGSLFTRIRDGLFLMNIVKASQNAKTFTFSGDNSHFISLVLQEGQEVLVNPKHLCGFSSTVQFRSHWNFSLAMLALHHPRSFVARGPGRLVLKSLGAPTSHDIQSNVNSVSLGNFILFDKDSKFRIEASSGPLNYFASGCVVRPTAGQVFITIPGTPSGQGIVRKIWELIKQVYMPI